MCLPFKEILEPIAQPIVQLIVEVLRTPAGQVLALLWIFFTVMTVYALLSQLTVESPVNTRLLKNV